MCNSCILQHNDFEELCIFSSLTLIQYQIATECLNAKTKAVARLGSTVSGAEQSRRSWSVRNLIDWHRRGEIKRNMGGGSHGGDRGTGGGAGA